MHRKEMLECAAYVLQHSTDQSLLRAATSIKNHYEVYFPITSLHRDDFVKGGLGYDASGLDDDDMENIAQDIADAIVSDTYWEALEEIAEDRHLPKLDESEES